MEGKKKQEGFTVDAFFLYCLEWHMHTLRY